MAHQTFPALGFSVFLHVSSLNSKISTPCDFFQAHSDCFPIYPKVSCLGPSVQLQNSSHQHLVQCWMEYMAQGAGMQETT